MAWVLRGLRDGIVTTPYPRRADGYGAGYRGSVVVRDDAAAFDGVGLAEICPTGAISVDTGDAPRALLDHGRCILCGRCVLARPDLFAFDPSPEVASLAKRTLVVPHTAEDDADLARLRAGLRRRTRALRRSIHIRHVDAGSDGSEEWEVAALTNPVYDVQRLGIFFTASPRHADILLATGAGTAGMAGPLLQTFEAMPEPRIVIATGTDAVSGGLVHRTYATRGGIGSILPVDVWVPGSPPSPFGILHGILLAVGLLGAATS
ncbi:MAG: NADH:ubiquinone oxidoreductase [Acidimicrobiales bacterium]